LNRRADLRNNRRLRQRKQNRFRRHRLFDGRLLRRNYLNADRRLRRPFPRTAQRKHKNKNDCGQWNQAAKPLRGATSFFTNRYVRHALEAPGQGLQVREGDLETDLTIIIRIASQGQGVLSIHHFQHRGLSRLVAQSC
jgi:hypothetical protein